MKRLCAALLLASIPLASHAGSPEYSPRVRDDFPRQVLWGDTHVHSSFSMDASAAGNTRLSPEAAYRFARGEPVEAHNGMTARLTTPLDFLVVSDHAEYMGLLPKLRANDPSLLGTPEGAKLREQLGNSAESAQAFFGTLIYSLMRNEPAIDDEGIKRSIWHEITRLADLANDPGHFSALIGYEWTSMPAGDNLHRVVVYGDAADRAAKLIPFSAFDGDRPEDLWNFMRRYEQETQGRILAIPHNSNLSNGRMFALEDSQGKAFDADYAAERARLEPLVEVTQIKGDSETHPLLSPDDEFAEFESWDTGNLAIVGGTVPKRDGMLQYEYVRRALEHGISEERRLGVNPFRFGMIGSTDAHTSLATGAEDNFWGKATPLEPSKTRSQGVFFESAGEDRLDVQTWQQVASGYAAVWAVENTREAIFDAMKRREVYATTGSRITVRFFGGWEYDEPDLQRHDMAQVGYQKGVPMGGVLPKKTRHAPRFLVMAARDPLGANLDRIQIVKGWIDGNGDTRERVFDVALSDGRTSRPKGARVLESTVDAETATYRNDIGAPQLAAFWADPYFEPDRQAFYYVRVLEIPTPRWTTYDAVRLGAEVPSAAPKEIQDRAYTSPIWYAP